MPGRLKFFEDPGGVRSSWFGELDAGAEVAERYGGRLLGRLELIELAQRLVDLAASIPANRSRTAARASRVCGDAGSRLRRGLAPGVLNLDSQLLDLPLGE